MVGGYSYLGGPWKPGATQSKAYTGTAGVIDNPIGSGVTIVRVWLTTAGFIAIGSSPTATTSDIPMPANTPEYFVVPPGSKVSAIQSASGGTLYVTEMSR
jgi:hypothetical protein